MLKNTSKCTLLDLKESWHKVEVLMKICVCYAFNALRYGLLFGYSISYAHACAYEPGKKLIIELSQIVLKPVFSPRCNSPSNDEHNVHALVVPMTVS